MSDKLTNDLISLIFNTGQVLKEKARSKTEFKECSFLHIQILHYIKDRKITNMKDLANYLHITPPSTTSLINSLVAKGFVSRLNDEADRRLIQLKITSSGLELLKGNLKRVTDTMKENINKLNASEKKDFINILNKISK